MYPHRIRLRGPWDCEPLASTPQPRRVIMPCRWLGAELAGYRGVARFVRKFGYPGRVDESEHVWLTCTGCTGCQEVRLNGHLLSQDRSEQFAFDVSPILTHRNRLEVLIQGESDESGLWGDVALEIRKDAYLSDLHVERTESGFRISGKAVGVSPRPLELYTLLDNQHVDYRTLHPHPEGTPFQIEAPAVLGAHATVRIELIDVSVIWYAVEAEI